VQFQNKKDIWESVERVISFFPTRLIMATNKQKALAKELLESKGKISMGQAMINAGYSPDTANNPQQVTRSEGWLELVDKMLPDEKILLRHAEGLDATKVVSSHTEPDYTVPDYAVRKQYIELGYKVKGKLRDTQVNILNQGGDMNLQFVEDK